MTDQKYSARETLLREVFMKGADNDGESTAISLERLVSLMKERSIQEPFLSSLYFAGADVDHPFFLKNRRIAIGVAVLPEDRAKTELTKKHPHQQEVIFVLQGELILEVDQDGSTVQKRLGVGSVYMIEKGQCHRILPVDNQDAAFLFVKTNPSEEPREEHCHL